MSMNVYKNVAIIRLVANMGRRGIGAGKKYKTVSITIKPLMSTSSKCMTI